MARAEVNRARMGASAERAGAEAELGKIKRRLRQIVDAIGEGVSARSLKDELLALEAREDVLNAKLAATPELKVLLNPRMADMYRARMASLHEALSRPDADREAAEAIRSLVDKVALVPADREAAHRPLWRDRPDPASRYGPEQPERSRSGLRAISDGCGGWI